MMRLLIIALSCTTPLHALAFCPADRQDFMWDTWLYIRPDGKILLNYLVKHHPPVYRWNAVSTAISSDGAHFVDHGVAITKDCANATSDCAVWLGSGSVWPLLPNASSSSSDDDDDEYVMNYSQQYDCGGGDCQAIFFATSRDLLKWTPVAPDAQRHGGNVFQLDTRYYQSVGGRWDCIAVLPRPEGGYYGYWTATPKNVSGGAGFGFSSDGLHWSALPTPGPNAPGEVGGVCQLSGRIFMTYRHGLLYEATNVTGPFAATKSNTAFLTGGGVAFPRLWGQIYTHRADLCLISHQHVNRKTIYAGLIKRAVLGKDGVLRASWWEKNNLLKGPQLAVASSAHTYHRTDCVDECLSSGLWLEGTVNGSEGVPSGLWLETTDASGGVAFLVNVSTGGAITFLLGQQSAPGVWVAGKAPFRIDHAMARTGADPPNSWRLVMRNAWSAEGMVEFYVDDIVSVPYTVDGALTGVFAPLGGATVGAVHRLTLPQQQLDHNAPELELEV